MDYALGVCPAGTFDKMLGLLENVGATLLMIRRERAKSVASIEYHEDWAQTEPITAEDTDAGDEATQHTSEKTDSDGTESTGDEDVYTERWHTHLEAKAESVLNSQHECTVCQEMKPLTAIIYTSCNHAYCQTCFQSLCRSSMANESLFPPRCCRQPIDLELFSVFLSSEILIEYAHKELEYKTSKRTYCFAPSCSAFIPPTSIAGNVATCQSCEQKTCTQCKSPDHKGDCEPDPLLQPVLDAANENGWQSCFNCSRLVELDVGCNHMTCLCGAQFCYACGSKWKTCSCQQWSEDRLLEAQERGLDGLEGIDALEDGEVHLAMRPLEAQIANALAGMRRTQECTHQWQRVVGEDFCEGCYRTVPGRVMECRSCLVMACTDCSGHSHGR